MRWAGLLLLAGCKQIFGLDEPVPRDANPPCAALDIAVGYQHSCMVDDSGAVLCWGGNDSGQANPGISDDVVTSPAAIMLPGRASAVGAGRHFSCALLETGEVWCWGDNTYGQLGDGTRGAGGPPVLVPALVASSISVGARTVCARRTDDLSILCWGDSRSNQAGYTDPYSSVPRMLAGTAGTQHVASGHAHTCAIDGTGRVSCWGRGSNQQLGSGTTSTPTPVSVSAIGDVVDISTSARSSCAVTPDGQLICWGANADGQLALGDFDSPRTPTVTQATDVVEVDLGVSGGCARDRSGGVSCWGILRPGDGTWATSSSPRPALVQNATKLAHGFFHACAIADGTVQCWGLNDNAELGRGASSIQTTPMPVTLGFSPDRVAVGDEHVCAKGGNEVRCWGHNERGQLGNGSADGSSTPVTVAHGLDTALLGIAAGARATCVYTSSGAKCWGDNRFGQLGAGVTSYREVSPVSVQLNQTITKIAMGQQHACAVTGAEPRCWGNNNRGQLGIGTTQAANTPQLVSVPQVVDIALGNSHTCARTLGSALYCWGNNSDGQLGDGTFAQRNTPAPIMGMWAQVVAGSHHTCGITGTGTIQCWGNNEFGQLGIGSTVSYSTPQAVTNFPGTATKLFGGGSTMCAINNTGNVYCWGRNDFGQLGDGARTNRLVPTRIVSISVLNDFDVGILGGCRILTEGQFDCWGVEAMQAAGSYDSATPMAVNGGSCAK
jgi:alpha-tubulin suppressor-like RCC1 family protein